MTTERPIEQIREVLRKKGFVFFERGDWNINLIPVRENEVFDNTFSDSLYIIYKDKGVWQNKTFKFTTLAGTLGFGGEQSPLTAAQTGTGVDGTAIILEGQYRSALRLITDGVRYPFTSYLAQARPFNYLRDFDKNGFITRNAIRQTGNFFTHWHAMSNEGVASDQVNFIHSAWSQGCMGSDHPTWFGQILPLLSRGARTYGNLFSFTLLNRSDF